MQAFLAVNLFALVLLYQRPNRWRYIAWAVSAVAAVYTYYGAVLVVFVSSVALLVRTVRQHRSELLIPTAISLGVVALSLIPLVIWMLPQQLFRGPTSAGISFAWLGLIDEMKSVYSSTCSLAAFQFTAWPWSTVPLWPTALLIVIPLISLVFYGSALGRRVFIWLTGTVLVYYAVSRLGLYPYKYRYGMIVAPMLATCIACGVAAAYRRRPKSAGLLTISSVVLLLFAGLAMLPQSSVRDVLHAHESWPWPEIENSREVFGYLYDNRLDGDEVYVYGSALPAFEYYMTLNSETRRLSGGQCWLSKSPEDCAYDKVSIGQWIRSLPADEKADSILTEYSEPPDRLWLLFSHIVVNEDTDIIDALSEQYEIADEYHERGASAYYLQKR